MRNIRIQKLAARSQRSKVRGQRSEVRGQRSEVRFLLFFIFCFLFSVFCLLSSISAEEIKEGPVAINADVVEFFEKENIIKGSKNVEVIFEDMRLTADEVIIYLDSEDVKAIGNVTLYQNESIFRGDKVKYNFRTRKGEILEASMAQVGPWFGRGDRFYKVSEREYKIKEGYITTCNLEIPCHRIQADNIKLYLGKKIVAKNVFFYVRNIPIFFLPYYVHPLDDRRPRVSFIPGHSSQWGYFLLSSWRYFLSEDAAGRIHLDYRELKGFASGFDHKYSLYGLGKGRLRVYYMNERDKAPPDNQPPFRERERYRVQLRHSARLADNILALLEYNKMGDKDFIKDYFYQEYRKDKQPESFLSIIKRLPNHSLSFFMQKRTNRFFTVTEYLPQIELKAFRRKIRDTLFFHDGEFSLSNLTHKQASPSCQDDDVVRFDIYNSISIPKRLLNFLNINPYVAIRQTYYSKDRFGNEDIIRWIFYSGVDASTRFHRVYNVETNFLNLDINQLRHIITPTINYAYIHPPTIAATDLMRFDAIDNISRKNALTLGIGNRFQTRRQFGNEMKTYELGYFLLTSNFDFELENGNRWINIKSDLGFTPFSWLRFEHDSEFDPQIRDFKSSNLDLIVNRNDWSIGLGYRYQKDISSLLTTQFSGKLGKLWDFRTYMRYEYQTQTLEEFQLSLTRDLCCWLVDLVYNYDEPANDHTFYVVFRLKAFPEIPFKVGTTYHRPRSLE